MHMCCSAQFFDYNYDERRVSLKPTFDTYSLKGKKSGLLGFSGDDFLEKMNSTALKFLSKQTIDYLTQNRGGVIINFYISPSGIILYLTFSIKRELFDLNLITEEQLKGMYDSYKQLQFEVSKFDPGENFDFCPMVSRVYMPESATP